MTSIIVRPADPADFASIGALSVAAYRADGQLTEGNPYESLLVDVAARAQTGELLIAEQEPGSGVVGAVLFVLPGSPYAELSGPGEAEFRMLAVDPSAQGRGVGEALARACIARAGELGCRAVVICSRDFAQAAHRLYARLGFARLPERDWSPRPGINLLALRLQLPVPDPSGPE
jgi:ribosomal protein S18 acetylase RimI-like enzyme